MKLTKLLYVALAILTMTVPVLGQSVSTSQIHGAIQDQSGANVANAQIILTQTDTGQVHKITSNEVGTYIITDLPSGSYSLQVSSAGFSNYLQKNIVLDVGTNPEI